MLSRIHAPSPPGLLPVILAPSEAMEHDNGFTGSSLCIHDVETRDLNGFNCYPGGLALVIDEFFMQIWRGGKIKKRKNSQHNHDYDDDNYHHWSYLVRYLHS